MTEEIIKKFEQIRDLPYEIGPLYEGNDLIKYGKSGCGPKNRYLANYFYKNGYKVKVCWTPYQWKNLKILPNELLKYPNANRIGNHVYLKVKINNKWILIDASWDKKLFPLFPVNVNWDGESNQIPAVKIKKEICMDYPEPYLTYRRENNNILKIIHEDKNFAKAMNNWLEIVRKNAKANRKEISSL